MEKTFMDCGVSTEELTSIALDLAYEMLSSIDIDECLRKVKENHPAVTGEQWDILISDDIPDFKDRTAFDQLLEEMHATEALERLFAPQEDEPDEEPLE